MMREVGKETDKARARLIISLTSELETMIDVRSLKKMALKL